MRKQHLKNGRKHFRLPMLGLTLASKAWHGC